MHEGEETKEFPCLPVRRTRGDCKHFVEATPCPATRKAQKQFQQACHAAGTPEALLLKSCCRDWWMTRAYRLPQHLRASLAVSGFALGHSETYQVATANFRGRASPPAEPARGSALHLLPGLKLLHNAAIWSIAAATLRNMRAVSCKRPQTFQE